MLPCRLDNTLLHNLLITPKVTTPHMNNTGNCFTQSHTKAFLQNLVRNVQVLYNLLPTLQRHRCIAAQAFTHLVYSKVVTEHSWSRLPRQHKLYCGYNDHLILVHKYTPQHVGC